MKFNLLNIEDWHRKEYYNYYLNNIPCTYSLTVDLDITNINGENLYPTMLWLLTKTVNEIEEFRTSLSPEGVGIFEKMNPAYTIFNKTNKKFCEIWTEFNEDYSEFLKKYQLDRDKYSSCEEMFPKKNRPSNTFDVSMIPWITFSSFNLNIKCDGNYLLPIFTIGKTYIREEKVIIPLAIQVHHGVCDGYHIGLFINNLQEKIIKFK